MTIRLTSVESFEKVLQKIKQDQLFKEKNNESFLKYCVETIKEGLTKGDDEYYLVPELRSEGYEITIVLSYFRRSDIKTDIEWLKED